MEASHQPVLSLVEGLPATHAPLEYRWQNIGACAELAEALHHCVFRGMPITDSV